MRCAVGPILTVVLLAAAAVGCGPALPPEGLTAPATPTPLGRELVVENRSDETICYVYISPIGQAAWGPDRLDPSETIPPGTQRGFGMAQGSYDLRLQDCARNELAMRRNVPLGGSEPAVVFSFTGRE